MKPRPGNTPSLAPAVQPPCRIILYLIVINPAGQPVKNQLWAIPTRIYTFNWFSPLEAEKILYTIHWMKKCINTLPL